MALALPIPAAPGPSSAQARAHRRWQAGQSHAAREQWPLAAQAFEQAAALHGDPAYALHAAHALIKSGRAADAARRARGLRATERRNATAYLLESHALLGLGRAAEAVECLQSLPVDVSRDSDHHVSLAVALQRCDRHEDAIRSFFDALALQMDDALSHFRLGMSFKELGLKAEAAECVRTAIVLGVGSSELAARAQLVFLEREACRWAAADEAMTELRRAVRALPADTPVETGVFSHAVLVDDPLEQLAVARHYALHVAAMYPPLPRRAARRRDGRLRIGYLSADFHQHATSQLLVEMLERHDRSRFEVTLLSTGRDDKTALRQRVVAASEHFEELRGIGFEEIAVRIRKLGIDILVDLKGATHDTLLPVLAQRPAPLQVGWLGFPGTSGAPYIDYFIGDAVVSPLADAAHFGEQIAQLPRCYQPNDSRRALPLPSSRAEWDMPDDALVLCGFHQSYKISAEVFDAWCQLLRRIPGSLLWLLQWNVNVQAALVAAAQERGIDATRLRFAPLLPLQGHLSRLAHADVFLDTWPCNGHTTAGEALWVGVPVVTLRGRTFAQRVAASLLRAVDLDELVCTDITGYLATTVALAADPRRRAALREHLLVQRATSPLFDGARFARDIEKLFVRIWSRAVAGEAPGPIAATEIDADDGVIAVGEHAQLPRNDGVDRAFAAQAAT
jgi:predicted O-linked N-acetylglucosamine transferase (SPINDLY family)